MSRKKAQPQAQDGEWIRPKRRGFILECCGCGLTHRLNFRVRKTLNGGHAIEFQSFRQPLEPEDPSQYWLTGERINPNAHFEWWEKDAKSKAIRKVKTK